MKLTNSDKIHVHHNYNTCTCTVHVIQSLTSLLVLALVSTTIVSIIVFSSLFSCLHCFSRNSLCYMYSIKIIFIPSIHVFTTCSFSAIAFSVIITHSVTCSTADSSLFSIIRLQSMRVHVHVRYPKMHF